MGNKAIIMKECDKANVVRRVCKGRVNRTEFFQNVYGHLLISGCEAGDIIMLADMICEYAERNDMPTVVLSSHSELLSHLQEMQNNGMISGSRISSPDELNYHPMYGMSEQQVMCLLRVTGEDMGCTAIMDRVLLYAAAVINIVSAKYPVSLPALSTLLKEDDDFIASFAGRMGMSNVITDNILGSCEAGIMLRRIVEKLEEALGGISRAGNDTKYNFQSGARENIPVMAFYQISSNQRLMNAYLKEELYSTLKRVSKIRVILDEAVFLNETDELLTYLFQMKRQGKIELIAVSENAKEMLPGTTLDFGNVCLFLHANPSATEELSRELFGTYQYHYPVCAAGHPPTVLITFKKDIHWQIAVEERLRVRAEDLYGFQKLFGFNSEHMAVRTTYNSNIYLIPADKFFSRW